MAGRGSALEDGVYGGGTSIGFPDEDVKPGALLGFAFPGPENTSDTSVTLTGFKLLHVPSGVKVVKYAVLSAAETDGQLLASRIGTGRVDDYDTYKDHLAEDVRIPSKTLSDFYPVVYLKVTGEVEGAASGCEYHYTQGERALSQTLNCEFTFTNK